MSEETIITAAVQLRYRREHLYTSTLAAPKYLRYIVYFQENLQNKNNSNFVYI
jgi:hypothetical protein